ncbi:MAG: LD-carboxypeptidase [Bacteroidota bacterium]
MKTLLPLKQGSKIRIVSPAGKINEKHVLPAVDWLEKQGYKVELGKHVFAQYYPFAGTDEQRIEDLQTAMDDSETDAIICSRGGYGMVRIIDKLDFTQFQENPKWLVGYSDITILHSSLNNLGIETIHGVMPKHFFEKDGNLSENVESLMTILTGGENDYSIPPTEFDHQGKVKAELVGGNLSIIVSLLGTIFDLDTDGKILFIEDIDEYLYHTDRMMIQLKLAGKLSNLAGLIVGDFTDMKDEESPFGKTVEEIIMEAVSEFDYPVCFGFPAGHDKKNLALTFGREWELNVSEDGSTLKLD